MAQNGTSDSRWALSRGGHVGHGGRRSGPIAGGISRFFVWFSPDPVAWWWLFCFGINYSKVHISPEHAQALVDYGFVGKGRGRA